LRQQRGLSPLQFIMGNLSYKYQLRKPEWQKKRLEIMQRDNFTCQICLDTEETLQVHHKSYDKDKKAWEYGNDRLITLCETCHSELTEHIKKHKTEENFSLIKYRNGNLVTIIVYTNGNVILRQNERWIALSENISRKLVHFIINNWLKNG
jgi:hypothetical protein